MAQCTRHLWYIVKKNSSTNVERDQNKLCMIIRRQVMAQFYKGSLVNPSQEKMEKEKRSCLARFGIHYRRRKHAASTCCLGHHSRTFSTL